MMKVVDKMVFFFIKTYQLTNKYLFLKEKKPDL